MLETTQDGVVDGLREVRGHLLGGDKQLARADLVGQKGDAPVQAALVASTAGSTPGQITGVGAAEAPTGRVLEPVVGLAQAGEIAEGGHAAVGPGLNVVCVATTGGDCAARERAGVVPGLHEFAQGGRGPVVGAAHVEHGA